MTLLFLVLVGLSCVLIIAGKIFFPRALTGIEIAVLFGGSLVLAGGILMSTFFINVHDFDILNGKVVSKQMERVHCVHSYQCNCVTYKSGKSTTRVCQTCYLHPFDQVWEVHTTLGTYDINTEDSQGLIEPGFWRRAQKGDPVAREESVVNYLKASPDSLFHQSLKASDAKKFKGLLPTYPEVHDYYEIQRVATLGFTYPLRDQLNHLLSQRLETLGPSKQVNVVIVLVKEQNRAYARALERQWNGAKKNDVVVVIGVDHYPHIAWADAFSFAKSQGNEMLMIKLRDQIEDLGQLNDPQALVSIIGTDVQKYFHRLPMARMAYLKHDYSPSGAAIALAIFLYLLFFGAGYAYCLFNDVRN